MNLRIWWEALPGYAYQVLVLLVTVLLLPWQAKLLGTEAWAMVAFAWTIHALLFAVDLAFGPLLLRDLARDQTRSELRAQYLQFHQRYRQAALLLTGLAALILAAGKQVRPSLPLDLPSLLLLAAVFQFQVLNACATGFWNARAEQWRAGLRSAGFLLLKHALATILVFWIAPEASLYLLGFVLGAGLEWHVNRRALLKHLAGPLEVPARKAEVRISGWDQFGLAGLSALLALIGSQLDRLWFAATLPTETFAQYALVVLPFAAYLSLQMPLQRSLLPRLSRAEGSAAAMRQYWQAHALLALPCLLLAWLSPWLLPLWLHQHQLDAAFTSLFRQLWLALAGTVLMGPIGAFLIQTARWHLLIRTQVLSLLAQILLFAFGTAHWQLFTAVPVAWVPTIAGILLILLVPALRGTVSRADEVR